jgi:4-coumarate--CoA ligase
LELEEILVRHPLVKEAAVHSVWSEQNATDLIRAYIVSDRPLIRGGRETEEAAKSIAEFVARQVAGYKQLKGGVVFVDSLPKSPTGKLLRRLLKDIEKTGSPPLLAKL